MRRNDPLHSSFTTTYTTYNMNSLRDTFTWPLTSTWGISELGPPFLIAQRKPLWRRLLRFLRRREVRSQ